MFNSSMGLVMLCVAFSQQPTSGPTAALGRSPSVPATVQQPAARVTGDDACGLDAARRYTGGTATPTTREAVAKAAGHTRIRWIKPGEIVTQDYRTDRLNVIIDDAGKILTMRCG